MKLTRRAVAVLLALLMALSMPLIALAEGADPNFTLTVNTSKLYAGMSYDVVAKITNATAAEASASSAFAWSISSTAGSATINSKNNFEKTLNSDGTTYTVTESATFVMPQAGATVTVSARFASRNESLDRVSYQPIESYGFRITNDEHCFYDENNNTLYLDRADNGGDHTANIDITNIQPATNEDKVTANVSGFEYDKYSVTEQGSNSGFSLSFTDEAKGKGTLNLITESGKTPQFIDVQCCIETTKYTLNYKKAGDKNATKLYKQEEENDYTVDFPSNIAVEGKAFEITATDFSSNANDFIDYKLYTDEGLTNPAASTYYAKNGNNCELSINVAGTYYLHCQNRSCDNGQLTRSLGAVIVRIIVSKAYPIQSIELFKLDENGNKTDEKLESILLYTDTTNETKTYALANSVTVAPTTNTDTVSYESNNTKVATVDATSGLITAVGRGTATVWVKSNDNANAATPLTVEVRKGIKGLSQIRTADGSSEIPSGHIEQLYVTTNPTDADQPIFWSSQNPDVLSIDKNTGVVTAKNVSTPTTVTIVAATSSDVTTSMPFVVVPAKRATSVAINVQGTSDTFKTDTSGAYPLYTDYSGKSFIVNATATAQDGTASNDKLVWYIAYDNGIGMTFDEARDAGLLTYTKSGNDYTVSPLKTEVFTITCMAMLDETLPTQYDKFDIANLKVNDTATGISVHDDTDNKELSNNGSVNLPIRAPHKITVKTSTVDNDKKADPAKMEILSGDAYVTVASAVSEDGEGVTYTLTGKANGSTKIKFSSSSGSVSKTVTFNVRNNLAEAVATGYDAEVNYTGSKIEFSNLKLMYNGSSIDSADYAKKYEDNTNAGTAKIIFTGKNNFAGSTLTVNFTIKPLSIANATVSEIKEQTITAWSSEPKPSPSVKLGDKTLSNNKDYVLTYKNNNRAGNATLTITAQGNYTGVLTRTFRVTDSISKATVNAIAAQTYSGKYLKPAPVVKYYGKTLVKGTDYTVTYTNNLNVGTATVKVEGMGFYTGSVSQTFIIKPKKEKIKSLKAAKKGFTVKWAAQTNIAGYQVQYALDKKFKKSKKTISVANNISVYKAENLKAKKKYYVRVRSFATINGKKVYGAWSPVKYVTTKK